MTKYKQAKQQLKEVAEMAKSQYSNDKPMIRQIINDSVDFWCKEYDFNEYKRNLLSLYACTLHPK